ncbi:MAG: class I SAM-dependent methyltransferase, partial [Lachnospiraceae bacterium]|nr:class I SAM-dependent methyltransferase [Lachnospiraceae bacterium]
MNSDNIIENNKRYWNEHADFWFGTTSLPEYGVKFVTEDELRFFKDVAGKKVLEICCGWGLCVNFLVDRK